MSPIVGSLANGSTRGYGGLRSFAPNTAFESIATATGTGSSASITFSSISNTYKHLQIRGIVKSTSTGPNVYGLQITFNSVTGTSYAYHSLYGYNSTATAEGAFNQAYGYLAYPVTDSGASHTNMFGAVIIDLLDYASTSKYKTMKSFQGTDTNDANGLVGMSSSLFKDTTAISSITLTVTSGNMASGSTFALYGIKG